MTRSVVGVAFFAAMTLSAQTTGVNAYVQHNLVSNVSGLADVTDPNLIDPWGMSFSGSSPFWVSNHGKGNTTVYSFANTTTGVTVSSTVVTIPTSASGPTPSVPTGQVQNSTTGFVLANGKAASFIFCTEDGTVSAWNGGGAATVMIDNSASGAVYKGMAIGTAAGGPVLYLANFSKGTVDVLDATFKPTTLAGSFSDPSLPAGLAPFNVWPVAGKLYVTYAKQDATKKNDVAGVGNGAVDVFDFNGNLVQSLTSGGPLNSPWGVVIVPGQWGALSGSLLVGNFGDGHINAFNPTTGALVGTMQNSAGAPIAIQGLWALLMGNGGSGGDPNYVYFTAGIINNGAQAGLLGSLAPPPQITKIQNAASASQVAIAPGEVVSISGIGIGPRPAVTATAESTGTGTDGTSLGGITVAVNGILAPILYTQADLANVIIPWATTGTNATIVITNGTTTLQSFQIPIAATQPGIFQGAALNQDGTLNSTTNPAAAGTVAVFYATGLGQTDPPGQDGARYSSAVLSQVVAPVTMTIGGQPAQVIYAGSAPGLLSGVMLVEAIIPTGAGTGGVQINITAGGVTAPFTPTYFLK